MTFPLSLSSFFSRSRFGSLSRSSLDLPSHIGLIMDGNGRWATHRGLPRSAGHLRGAQVTQDIVRCAFELGIDTLTLFCFSSENWERPRAEVDYLMNLFKQVVHRDLSSLHDAGVKVCFIGTKSELSDSVRRELESAERLTCDNDSHRLVIALNYGGRDEIVRAARRLSERVLSGELSPDSIDESLFSSTLDTSDWSDPDLIIRTSGEQRLSNFLLWQSAYSEFLFVNCHWPDFTPAEFRSALHDFSARHRRFGSVSSLEATVS